MIKGMLLLHIGGAGSGAGVSGSVSVVSGRRPCTQRKQPKLLLWPWQIVESRQYRVPWWNHGRRPKWGSLWHGSVRRAHLSGSHTGRVGMGVVYVVVDEVVGLHPQGYCDSCN